MMKQKIGKIIFSKVLEMPLVKYLGYIEKTTNGLTEFLWTYKSAPKYIFCRGNN